MRHPPSALWSQISMACAVATLVAASAIAHAQDAPGIAITDVTVIDVDQGRALPPGTVVIAGGRITAVGLA